MDSPNIPFFDFEVRHLVGVPKSSEIEKKAEALSQKLSNKYPDQKNIVVYKFNSNQEKVENPFFSFCLYLYLYVNFFKNLSN